MRSEHDYGRTLRRAWGWPGDLCVVEHDVEPNPGTLPSFEACPEPWCTAPYLVAGGLVDGIGCCRFREPARQTMAAPAGDLLWANVESAYVTALRHAGFRPHRHPPVTHHHTY
jgi:hypothetical protein